MLNPVPVALSWLMVTLPFPVLVKVTACVLLVPTVTFPKPIEMGEAASCRVTPVPERAIEVGELEALLMTERLPLALPPEVGANVALKLVLFPAARVRGSARPLKPNAAPVALA